MTCRGGSSSGEEKEMLPQYQPQASSFVEARPAAELPGNVRKKYKDISNIPNLMYM